MTHYPEEDLFKYIDGTYDKESEAVLSAHLKNCTRCSALYKELSVLDKELHQLPAEKPSSHFTAGIISKLYPVSREEPPISFTFFGQPLMVCGIGITLLILLISLGFLDAALINGYPFLSEWIGSPAFIKMLSKGLSGVCILVMLLVLDKSLLSPYFKRRRKEKVRLSH